MKESKNINWFYRGIHLGLTYRVTIILILLSLMTTITEIFGIGMFLPIFQFISLDGDIDALILDSTIWKYLIHIFDFFKIEPLFGYLLLLSFSFFMLRQILIYFTLIYNSKVKQGIIQTIRKKVFNRYMEADTLYHDSTPVGNLVNVITTETNMAASGIISPLELIVLFIMLFGYLLMLLFLSWQMTLLSVAILFIATKIPHIWIKQSASAGRNLVNANILMSEFLVGRLRSPRLVRLSGTKIAEKNEFNKLTKAQREHSVFTAILGVKTDVSMEPVLISLSLIFLYFSYSTLGLQVEVIGLYLVIVLRTLPIVKGILSKWQRIQRLLGSVEVIEDRLELMKNSIENDLGVESISQLKQSFTIDNVSYRYPSSGSDALKNIKIIFKANEMTAVVGASGSGKSTLIDLLPRLRTPTKGLIKIDDVNIEKYTLKSIREMISYAPQSPQIFDGTVRNHILYGKVDATESEVQEAIRLAGAEEFINQLPQGIDTILGEDAIKLSGGQRQRLDLARVLVKKTPILILDEPTSSLDAESESLFKQVLYKIRKERSTTIIIVSHRLASIFDADNIVVLNQGRVDGYGKHLDLLSQNGWYAKAWKTQK